MKRTITYTVYAVEGELLDVRTIADNQSTHHVGEITIRAFGDDGSTHRWPLHHGEPQPLIGSTFRHEIEIPDRGTA